MRKFAQIALLTCLSALAGAALAFDNGQYENVPPDIRAWFKGVMAPNGVPCCDISDGHRTEYDVREGGYWVPIDNPENKLIYILAFPSSKARQDSWKATTGKNPRDHKPPKQTIAHYD